MTKIGLAVAVAMCALLVDAVQAQNLHTFALPNFTGKEMVFRDPQPTLQASRPAKIASVRVVTARWLICSGTNYSGDCAWLSGNVPSLAAFGFTDEPGSLRPERVPVLMRHWGERRPAPRADLVLFEKPSFDGDWKALADSVPDFNAAHLTSPGSIVLAEGVWRLCTGPDYAGRCLIATASAWDMATIFPGRILSAKRLK
jgi:hypothetical protein